VDGYSAKPHKEDPRYEIVDAESRRILLCDGQVAPLLEKLLNWALSNYPFQHPEDPGIVNKGI
jgi:hypothetical protein